MSKEIIQGIFGGLFAIVIVVLIGSFIGAASSHGPKEAPAAPAPNGKEAPAKAGDGAKDAAKTDAPKAGGDVKEAPKAP